MKVELLHTSDCPHYPVAARLLREVLSELGLRETITETAVADAAQAVTLKFPGSPTIRIDGSDVDPLPATRVQRGLACRTYFVDGRLQGVPSRDMIARAIRGALVKDHIRSRQP
jgi:hypothetical protein